MFMCGQVLWVGCAIMGVCCLLAGNVKWVLYMFAGIVLGAFIAFDLPRVAKYLLETQ